jgi:hypothetical protein
VRPRFEFLKHLTDANETYYHFAEIRQIF